MENNKIIEVGLILLVVMFFSFSVGASGEIVGKSEQTVCCEKTNSGLFCQEVPETDCRSDSRAIPTACESTSFCNPGYCFDSNEGTCLGNVPQLVCNEEGGSWAEEKPAQCELGCCTLGDQASFVTLTRCKKLSSYLGLETNYNANVNSEAACILIASGSERGACVFEKEFETTCEVTTRADCTSERVFGTGSGETKDDVSSKSLEGLTPAKREVQTSPEDGEVIFNLGMLCSAEVLGTNCGPTKETTCLAGREEVYFVDSCGNPGNIYDSSKVNDDEYWTFIGDKSEACGANRDNANSQSCGNCNYLLGSYCRASETGTASPTHGENICVSLNCQVSEETKGKARLHGESWCGFDEDRDFIPNRENEVDEAGNYLIDAIVKETNAKATSQIDNALSRLKLGKGVGADFLKSSGAPVGSRFIRYSCINGEVVTEPCAEFRQEECLENVRETSLGDFTEAACRVNRWQDCSAQATKSDCVNSDVRDCKWLDGFEHVFMGGVADGSNLDSSSLSVAQKLLGKPQAGQKDVGGCVPQNPPGFNFWKGDEATNLCGQANALCPVTYEKGFGDDDWECVENCECLPGGSIELKRIQMCMNLGDCGPKVNWAGQKGRGSGYTNTIQDTDDE
jgi:hypothetical protein